MHFKQNRYEVPKGSYRPGWQALLEPDAETGKLRISDPQTGSLLAEHDILFGAKGKKISLPRNAERYKETKAEPPCTPSNRTSLPEKYENVRAQERGFDAYDSLLNGGAAQ